MRVVVENTDGDIFDPAYLEVLKQVNDELFLMQDVDRAWMKSIWTPAVRWSEVNEEGFVGGPVMPDNYDGSPASVDALKLNIRRANIVGNLVANDFRSSMVFVPLLERNAETGERLDYHAFSQKLEQRVRAKYENGGARQGQDPRDRLRQAGRRPDRRPGQGRQLLPRRGPDRRR